jgi:DNA gyrase/topoisomerase IV subunit B
VREELLQFFNRNKEIAEKIIAKVQDTRSCARSCRRSRSWRASGPRPSPSASRSSRIARTITTSAKRARARWCSSRRPVRRRLDRELPRREHQAIFVLKGKPLNVWDLKRDIVYKNDEMYNLMRSLDIEDNLEGLRYDKVILATDADVDGCTSAIC